MKKFVKEVWLAPKMETIGILPIVLCSSGNSTHESVEYDDDEPVFSNYEE